MDITQSGLLFSKSFIVRGSSAYPNSFLISLAGSRTPALIRIYDTTWWAKLNVRSRYKISRLRKTTETYKTNNDTSVRQSVVVVVFATNDISRMEEIFDVNPYLCLDNSWTEHSKDVLTDWNVKVEGNISPLGFVPLEGGLRLCFSLVSLSCKIITPIGVGDTIKVYNARRCKGNTIVMCARSSMDVISRGECLEDERELPPRIPTDLPGGYTVFAWLDRQLTLMEDKFPDPVISEACNVFDVDWKINALFDFLRSSENTGKYEERSHDNDMQRDFLSLDHECYVCDNPLFQAEDFVLLSRKIFLLLQELGQPEKQFWQSDVMSDHFFVGLLTVSKSMGVWILSDRSASLPVVSNGTEPISSSFLNSIVIIKQAIVVRETFSSSNASGGLNRIGLNLYILGNMDNIQVLKSGSRSLISQDMTSQTLHRQSCYLCKEEKKVMNAELCNIRCRQRWEDEEVLDLRDGQPIMHSSHHHLVVVHSIASPTLLNNEFTCFVLVTLLQRRVHIPDAGSCPGILVLSGRLMCLVPLLRNNVVYRIHLSSCAFSRFHHKPSLYSLNPEWFFALVPQESQFSVHTCTQLYMNPQLQSKALIKLINIEGRLIERKELPINIDAEKVEASTHGYGIPTCRKLLLIIVANGERCNIYLNHWQCRLYPLGMVCEAHVRVSCLTSHMSKNNNMYYASTDMTELRVTCFPDYDLWVEQRWGLPSSVDITANLDRLRTEIIVGPLPQGWMLWNVSIEYRCRLCNQPGESYRRCMTNECIAGLGEGFVSANAKISAHGIGGFFYMFLKDEDIRTLLNLTKPEWKMLQMLAPVSYKRYSENNVTSEEKSYKDSLLHILCLRTRLDYSPIHVRCKTFLQQCDISDPKASMHGRREESRGKQQSATKLFCVGIMRNPWQIATKQNMKLRFK